MSGYPTHTMNHNGCMAAGMHFIQKPFQRVLLARIVRELLD